MEQIAGKLTDEGHELAVRIYYEDTDFTGVVYHARYLQFMERGRSDFLRLLGVHHHALRDGAYGESLAFAVRKIDIDFLSPASIDDVLIVKTVLLSAKGARVTMSQQVLCDDRLVAEASLAIAVISGEGKPRRLPTELAAKLAR